MSNSTFSGSVPPTYDAEMGPVLFEPYAVETARRLTARPGAQWLEIAAGTGRVTRHLLGALPADGRLVATDLNADMLEVAKAQMSDPRLEWQIANGQELPFDAGSFDAVVNQFGIMFFPDKVLGHTEARRVLRPGGEYHFAVWGGVDENLWRQAIQRAIDGWDDPVKPLFGTPFSYANEAAVRADLAAAGFGEMSWERVELDCVAEDVDGFARGTVVGSPMAAALVARDVDPMVVLDAVRAEFARSFGDPFRTKMVAYLVAARN